MSGCIDQPYETEALVEIMIDAACSGQPDMQIAEVIHHFTDMHERQDWTGARNGIALLASQILYVVDSFRSRLPDNRFPYVRLPSPASLEDVDIYVMRRFEVDLDTVIQP